MESSPEVRQVVRRHVEKLELFCDRITSCRVMVEVSQRFPAGVPIAYNVRVELNVPGEEIVIKRQAHPLLLTAIQEAFDAAGRRLQDYTRRLRGDVKHGAEIQRGTVTQLFPFEGYGFLMTEDGREIYFHRNSVLDGAFPRMKRGVKVAYAEEEGEKGPQASTIRLLGKRLLP
jgi:cold shock CspA family protein/ribosome-associated translation inhibitor RaiA